MLALGMISEIHLLERVLRVGVAIVKWKGGEITPTMQQGSFSYGVFVMQV